MLGSAESVAASHGRISNELVAFDRTARTAALVSAGNFLANSGHSCSTPAATSSLAVWMRTHVIWTRSVNRASQDMACVGTHL